MREQKNLVKVQTKRYELLHKPSEQLKVNGGLITIRKVPYNPIPHYAYMHTILVVFCFVFDRYGVIWKLYQQFFHAYRLFYSVKNKLRSQVETEGGEISFKLQAGENHVNKDHCVSFAQTIH